MILYALSAGTAALAHASFGASIVTASAGLLLIYVECNRPGRVIPGLAGLLLFLLGLHSLSLLRLRPEALFIVALAFAMLVLAMRGAWVLLWLVAGTALLAPGLARLPAEQVWSMPAFFCGLLIGPVSGGLAAIAGRARRAKRYLRPLAGQPRPGALSNGWE